MTEDLIGIDLNTCKTCKWWDGSDSRDGMNYCSNDKLSERAIASDCLTIWTDIGCPSIATGPNFGCIHHEQKRAT